MDGIIITGSKGLLGNALIKSASKQNIESYSVARKNAQLLNRGETLKFIKHLMEWGYNDTPPDTLVHCAARVGGVQANMNDNAGFFKDNFDINRNVLESCYLNNIKNVVSILSTCVFPDGVKYPLTTDQIDKGRPHNSNYGYSYSKRLLRYETEVYKNVTGNNWLSVIPPNLYGNHDNYNLENSHLIPALIHKAYIASETGGNLNVWGNGTPLRQFILSDDMSDIILWAIDNWKEDKPLMAVNEREYSIKEVVSIIADRFNIADNRIKYDTTKPNGQHRKPAESDVPEWNFTPLDEGINSNIDWFLENKENIRKQ